MDAIPPSWTGARTDHYTPPVLFTDCHTEEPQAPRGVGVLWDAYHPCMPRYPLIGGGGMAWCVFH